LIEAVKELSNEVQELKNKLNNWKPSVNEDGNSNKWIYYYW
jgi:hypothetical protein